ncbi:EAL domain-containing protein [uncultured Hoeflea sp.]|uniref:putative bifunctional diguanylate cyclase/phosphodiesterase n=1 Tax=uncultured Hoeflea sp. TaxID=538666 RepID=UPI002625335D|nr:EAL domain-containing protein [uncultured Hoeflea sp.]
MTYATNLAALEQEVDAGTGTAQAPQANPRILVVDDVADNRDILTRRLVRRDFDVDEAIGGEDALVKIAENRYDVVLLDVMMPDLNGNEVLKRVREVHDKTQLPVIMVTAKSQSEDVVESINFGANDYITKPVDFAVALARINNQVTLKREAEQEEALRKDVEERAEELNEQVKAQNEALSEEASKRHVSEEKLRFMAYHDSLTGLLNRQGFRDTLQVALTEFESAETEPALIFIDLNSFKAVNDTHGHEVGDNLLVEVASRLSEVFGPDVPVARLGGDEFAAVYKHADQPASAMKMANIIVEKMSEPFFIDQKSLRIGASCGVARASAFSNDLNGLIKAADLAMYHAKGKGSGGAALFESRMLEEQEDRRKLETDLRLALQHSEFDVFYQPLVDMKTRQVVSFEALLRWPHKTRGMISPDIFIPLAEEIGLINQLGAWALRKACEEAANWPEHIGIAVNLSPIQFKSSTLLPTLVNALAATGLSPDRLELEVTESALLGAEAKNVKVLESIRELGVRVSMDDFGTGYSSLAYLQNFEFDKIKIDKRFIQCLETDTSNSAIVDAIIKLGIQIGIRTTAEGIETESQYKSVVLKGCSEGQGYLFSRPLTATDARLAIETGCA